MNAWNDDLSEPEVLDDVLQMLAMLQADVQFGPYSIVVAPEFLGLLVSTDRRYIRRRARRLGIRFTTQNSRPRLYILDLESRNAETNRRLSVRSRV